MDGRRESKTRPRGDERTPARRRQEIRRARNHTNNTNADIFPDRFSTLTAGSQVVYIRMRLFKINTACFCMSHHVDVRQPMLWVWVTYRRRTHFSVLFNRRKRQPAAPKSATRVNKNSNNPNAHIWQDVDATRMTIALQNRVIKPEAVPAQTDHSFR